MLQYYLYMLKKEQKLNRAEFANLLKKGKHIHCESAIIVYLNESNTKCGVTVSKKVAKKAVDRNLLRRRIYEIIQKNKSLIQKRHISVLAKVDSAQLSYAELKNTIREGFKKLN